MSYHKNMTGDDLHKTKIESISGSPNGVRLPEFIEEMIVDVDTQVLYTSFGLGINDWKSIGGVGGIPNLGDLSDVNKVDRVDKSFLEWDTTSDKYIHRVFETSTMIYVDLKGSDTEGTGSHTYPYQTITKALSTIIDNSTTKRYTILVAPGLHTIDNSSGPVQLKDFCNISSVGIQSVVFTPQDPTQDMFLGGDSSHLVGIIFTGQTGSSFVIRHETGGNTFIQNCVLKDVSNGFLLNHASGVFEINALEVDSPDAVVTNVAIQVVSGWVTLDGVLFRSTSKVNTAIEACGSGTLVSIHSLIAVSPNIGKVLDLHDGCQVGGNGNTIGYATDGLVVYGNDTTVEFTGLKIEQCSNDGFRIENTGTNISLSLFATSVIGCSNLNFNILNPNSSIVGNGFTELNRSYIVAGAKFYAYLLDISEHDEGLNIFGELHVGSPIRPTESVFGGGDSYTNGMLVYTSTAGGSFVNVSAEAKSASGSTFTFPELGVGSAIYVASNLYDESDYLKHYGIKLDVSVLRTGGIIVAEYWNGTDWTEVNGMETDSESGFYPHGREYFQHTGSHQIRYDSELSIDAWTKNDPVNLESDRYWVRFRVTSVISQAPMFEQFKLHTSRYEINADGWVEYFGKARPIGQLPLNLTSGKPLEGNMQSQSIWVNLNLGSGLTLNKFTATGDILGLSGFLPFDADTSSPLKLQWVGLASDSHTIEWTIRWMKKSQSDAYYTSDPGELPGMQTLVITKAIITGEVEIFEAVLPIPDMIARRENSFGDELWVSIQPTTLTGTFALTSSQSIYTKWCEGGHV